jgi:hypothetical protein
MKITSLTMCLLLAIAVGQDHTSAEVVSSEPGGFRLSIKKSTALPAKEVYHAIVNDYSTWWDVSHSYSGEAGNLSIDLDRGCIYEKLPGGGFVRHLELVYHNPGTALRVTGGLGPLQELGVQGALTFQLVESEGRTEIQVTYNVVGTTGLNLDQLAPIVDRVLEEQANRLQVHCEKLRTAESK